MKNLKKEALSDIKDWESIEIKFYLDGGLYLDIQDDEKSKSQFIDLDLVVHGIENLTDDKYVDFEFTKVGNFKCRLYGSEQAPLVYDEQEIFGSFWFETTALNVPSDELPQVSQFSTHIYLPKPRFEEFIDYTKKRIEDNKPLEDFSGFFRFEFKKLVDDLSLNRDGVIPIHSCFLTYKSDENGFPDNAFQSQEEYEKNKKELEDRWEKEKQEEKKKLN
ncbi:hypothetical protein N9M26_06050 [Alphaproteobacteria bacterium]|nr:hypothetical protein [Alphaproteobacteria bacterium]